MKGASLKGNRIKLWTSKSQGLIQLEKDSPAEQVSQLPAQPPDAAPIKIDFLNSKDLLPEELLHDCGIDQIITDLDSLFGS